MNTIEIGGTKYSCRMTMGAFRRFKQITGHDVSKMANDLDEMCSLLYAACASAANADGHEFRYSIDDFADRLSLEEVQRFGNELMQSMAVVPSEQKKIPQA